MVGKTGFEPATPYSQSRCTTKLCYFPLMVPRAGLEPARILLRRILSPVCLPIPPPGQLYNKKMVSRIGFEPMTHWLKASCSTDWASETHKYIVAGVVGFEPTVHDTKNRCLTAWLHPTMMVEGEGFEPPKPKCLIYSQVRLTTSLPLRLKLNGAGYRTRTYDLLITNQLLYHLS